MSFAARNRQFVKHNLAVKKRSGRADPEIGPHGFRAEEHAQLLKGAGALLLHAQLLALALERLQLGAHGGLHLEPT